LFGGIAEVDFEFGEQVVVDIRVHFWVQEGGEVQENT
jgi:hypothetical protein